MRPLIEEALDWFPLPVKTKKKIKTEGNASIKNIFNDKECSLFVSTILKILDQMFIFYWFRNWTQKDPVHESHSVFFGIRETAHEDSGALGPACSPHAQSRCHIIFHLSRRKVIRAKCVRNVSICTANIYSSKLGRVNAWKMTSRSRDLFMLTLVQQLFWYYRILV